MSALNGQKFEKDCRRVSRITGADLTGPQVRLSKPDIASDTVPTKASPLFAFLEPPQLPNIFLTGEEQVRLFTGLLRHSFQPRRYFEHADVNSVHLLCREIALTQGALLGQARSNLKQHVLENKSTDTNDGCGVGQQSSQEIRNKPELDTLVKNTGSTVEEVVARSILSGYDREMQTLKRLHELARQLATMARGYDKRRLREFDFQIRRLKQLRRLGTFRNTPVPNEELEHLKHKPELFNDAYFVGPDKSERWQDHPKYGTAEWVDHYGWPPLLQGEDSIEYSTLYLSVMSDVCPATWFEGFLVKQMVDLEWSIGRYRKAEAVLLDLTGSAAEDGIRSDTELMDERTPAISDGFSSQYASAESLAYRFYDEEVSILELADCINLASHIHKSLRDLVEEVFNQEDKVELARLKHIEMVRLCNEESVF